MKLRFLSLFLSLILMLNPSSYLASEVERVEEEGESICTVTADIPDPSQYTVTVPKNLEIDPVTSKSDYSVDVTGTLEEYTQVSVTPDETFEMTQNTKTVTATVTQDKLVWNHGEVDGTYDANGIVTVSGLTMGNWVGVFNFNINALSTFIEVTSKDEQGNDLDASATLITGERRDELLNSLEETGMISSKDDVDALINVESDDFDGMADTTFDVSNIAKEGDKVVILHFDETKQEWEYIGIETVDNEGKISGDFTSYSPVAFVKVDSEGNLIPIEALEPGLYNAEGTKLASWDKLEDDYNLDITADYSLSDTGESNMLASILGQSEFEDTIKIVVPNGVTRIGDCAFAMCENLTEIVVPSSVKEVGGYAFAGCMSLDCLKLPSSVDTVGYLSFYFVPYVVYDGLLDISYTGMNRLNDLYFTELTSEDVDRLGVIDSNGVATIPEYIERDGTTYAVRSISGRCFENNINLVEVIISNNIMMVNASAFWCCSNLETVKFEYSNSHLMSLLGSAFFKCTSLETIYLPKTLTFIDEGVFDDCTSLTTIYYEGSEDDWNTISINDYLNDYLINANKIYNSTMN